LFIRTYAPVDAEALAAIFRDAVIHTASSVYEPEQIAAWSAYPEDLENFRESLTQGLSLVAVVDNYPVAFGQLHPVDHIAYLYTASSFNRQGYGSAIYQCLEQRAIEHKIERLRTEASRVSKHFFLKMGFRVVEVEWVMRRGVQIERFKMEKILAQSTSPEIE
jgi:putative acetyltransferase